MINGEGFIDAWTDEQLADYESRAVARLHAQDRLREAAEKTGPQQPGIGLDDVHQQEEEPAPASRAVKTTKAPANLEEILALEGFTFCKTKFRAMKSIAIDGEQVRLFCDYPNGRPSFYARSDAAWIERSKVDELSEVRKVWRAFNALGSKKLTDFAEDEPEVDEDAVREFQDRLRERQERRYDAARMWERTG